MLRLLPHPAVPAASLSEQEPVSRAVTGTNACPRRERPGPAWALRRRQAANAARQAKIGMVFRLGQERHERDAFPKLHCGAMGDRLHPWTALRDARDDFEGSLLDGGAVAIGGAPGRPSGLMSGTGRRAMSLQAQRGD